MTLESVASIQTLSLSPLAYQVVLISMHYLMMFNGEVSMIILF